MTIPEILDALTSCTGEFPREAIAEAVAQREAITPELLRILEQDTANLAEIAPKAEYMAHLYAMYLLAQFREARAYPLLVKFFRADEDLLYQAVDDVTSDGLDRMLASTCQGDTSLIEQMIEDATLDEYARGAALGALVVLVTQGVISRDAVMEYFTALFRGKLEREFSFVWAYLVSRCCALYPEEVMADIEQAYADDLVDTYFIGMNSVKRVLAAGKAHALAELERDPRQRFIEDTIKELEWWACFTAPEVAEPTPPQPTGTPVFAPARTMPKVGRNAPCPCGSGKKYKRCCGA